MAHIENMVEQILATPSSRKQRESKNPRGVFEKNPGSGEWWIRFTDKDGRFRREKVGKKSSAIKLYQKRKTEAFQGKKLPETLRSARVTFTDIAKAAIPAVRAAYRARPADEESRLRVLMDWFGTREASAITSGEIEARFDDNDWAASTANHYRTLMSFIYRHARKSGKIAPHVDPVRDVDHRSEKQCERVRALSVDEETRLRAAIQKHYSEHELELDFALHTGLRQGNQYQLTWDMVDWQTEELKLPQTKNGYALRVPFNAEVGKVLTAMKARGTGEGRVFISAETGEPLESPKHWFTKAVRFAEIDNFHWHDLRHTFATRLRAKGERLENIAALLGHKGLAMTQRYAHHTDESRAMLRKAVGHLAEEPTDTTTDTKQFEAQNARAAGAR